MLDVVNNVSHGETFSEMDVTPLVLAPIGRRAGARSRSKSLEPRPSLNVATVFARGTGVRRAAPSAKIAGRNVLYRRSR
jgi:hypothetical protein